MAASSLELDWTESDLSSSPEPADKNAEKESSKTDEHEVINSALSGPLLASTPKKCREDRYASYTEISFGSEELSRPSVEISFGSEHSEPALISLDFGQSSGLSSVPASNVTDKDEVESNPRQLHKSSQVKSSHLYSQTITS